MRIGIDARLWNETGVGRYIRNLVKHLQLLDKENEYVLFVRNDSGGNFKIQITNDKWRVVHADVRWHSLAEQWEMPKVLEKEKLDLVHFPYFNVPVFYNKPFIVTIHDLIINHFPTGQATTLPWPLYQIKRLGYQTSLSHAVRNSQKIIAVSETTKGEIVDHFGVKPEKVVVTYESGELEINKNHESGIMNHGIKKPYILYVGNAHPHKNLERLMEAFNQIKNQKSKIKMTNHDLKLILVGKDDYFYQRLKNWVETMGLSERVVFYGEASDAELRHLYKNATALILPSLMEGFGLPALEAMGQGCLVLASDIFAFREVCEGAAIYFDPLDIDAIAKTIEQVCSHDLPAGKAGSNHSNKINDGLKRAKIFSWEKMAKETLNIYKEAAVCL
ncbi:MAG: glycosyltransferase family 1 protein [bacterium]|nr:glycosyltransferase family 1 protein [bacterium]